jgi:hypothetical protein
MQSTRRVNNFACLFFIITLFSVFASLLAKLSCDLVAYLTPSSTLLLSLPTQHPNTSPCKLNHFSFSPSSQHHSYFILFFFLPFFSST